MANDDFLLRSRLVDIEKTLDRLNERKYVFVRENRFSRFQEELIIEPWPLLSLSLSL